LNFAAGQTVPNAVIAPVDVNGEVCFQASDGATDLIADVNGWFPMSAEFQPVVPARVFDTRSGQGGVPVGPVEPGARLVVRVTGGGGVPASGVSAVSLNVTAAVARAAGFVTVFPCAAGLPAASSLNFAAGQTVPNAVIAPVDVNGEVCFQASDGATDLIADVNGWFA
jgi:hypothetical protein